MFRVIALIMIFLVILYIYTFIKIKKNRRRREQEPTFVEQYHKRYLKRTSGRPAVSDYNYYAKKNSDIQNYVTKYNSPVDYIEKDSLNL